MLEVRNLTRDFVNEGRTVRAVRQVSFAVPQGELFTLLGPSGCGKTTTLRCIAGLDRPDGGEIVFAGKTLYSSRARIMIPAHDRQIGMVFQSYAIWPHMTVFENAAFPLRVGKKYREKEIAERVMRTLSMVSLDGLEGRQATQLSGGQQQRLALARALVNESRLLLLDEPLSNLDAKLRERMRFELKRLQRELGLTTVFVTHDQNEALALSDKMAVMKDGEIVQIGAPREIYNCPRNKFVADFIGTANILEGVVVASAANGEHRVRTSLGEVAASGAERFPEGSAVCVSVRPEQIMLCNGAEPSAHAWPAKILGQVFLGDRLDLELDAGRQVLMARINPGAEVAVGDSVSFSIASRCAMFAA